MIQRAIELGQTVVFAFLSYKHREAATKLGILHSFLFQLLQDHRQLRPVLINAYESNYRQLQSSTKFVGELLRDVISAIVSVTFLVVDGLDEIDGTERQALLGILLELSNGCSNLRLWVSSRDETDISRLIRQKAEVVSVGDRNKHDIKLYVDAMSEKLLSEIDIDPPTALEIGGLIQDIPQKAGGNYPLSTL